MINRRTTFELVLPLILALLHAVDAWGQTPCGAPSVFITATPARIGGTTSVTWGSPTDPFALTALVVSDDPSGSTVPGVGSVCLNVQSPLFSVLYVGSLDAFGEMTLSANLPNIPGLTTNPPLFVAAAVVRPGGIVATRVLRIELENPGAYKATLNPMSLARTLHTATALHTSPRSPDNRVLIAGGGPSTTELATWYATFDPSASDTTELYDPLTRSFTPGPSMSTARGHHQAVLLQDGRVLISGGVDTTDIATTLCEVFDPTSGTFTSAASMNAPRAAHRATVLDDGRVLVTGGFQNLVGTSLNYTAAINSVQNTGEVYDPATDTWTLIANVMSTGRGTHMQHLLPDGRVIIIGGVNYAYTYPGQPNTFDGVYTTWTCDYYYPTTEVFGQAPGFTPSGIYGWPGIGATSTMYPNGHIIVQCGLWVHQGNPMSPTFSGWGMIGAMEPALEIPRFAQAQVILPDGSIQFSGGIRSTVLSLCATDSVLNLGGPQYFAANIGTNPGIPTAPSMRLAFQTMTELFDGSFLIAGGQTPLTSCTNVWGAPLHSGQAGAWIFTP